MSSSPAQNPAPAEPPSADAPWHLIYAKPRQEFVAQDLEVDVEPVLKKIPALRGLLSPTRFSGVRLSEGRDGIEWTDFHLRRPMRDCTSS